MRWRAIKAHTELPTSAIFHFVLLSLFLFAPFLILFYFHVSFLLISFWFLFIFRFLSPFAPFVTFIFLFGPGVGVCRGRLASR